jgi:hypothetical protein
MRNTPVISRRLKPNTRNMFVAAIMSVGGLCMAVAPSAPAVMLGAGIVFFTLDNEGWGGDGFGVGVNWRVAG